MKFICFIIVSMLMFPCMINAMERPSPENAKKVIDYYYNGKGNGTILMEYQLCKEIQKEGAGKNTCADDMTDTVIKKGEKVFLWMHYFIPYGDKINLLAEYKIRNKVRKVTEFTVSGGLRYRTWKQIATKKTGEWSVSIIQELDDKDLEIGNFKYTVK
jgi:hypothetical protein